MSGTFGLGGAARVACGTGLDNINTGTLGAWVRVVDATPASGGALATKHPSNWRANITPGAPTGSLGFRRGGSTALNVLAHVGEFSAFATGIWLFLALEFDFAVATPTLWMGAEATAPAEPATYVVQQPGVGTADDNAAETMFLGNDSGFAAGFDGDIHSVAIYAERLTAGQLNTLRVAMAAGDGESIDDGAGGTLTALASWVVTHTGTVTDQTGNGHDGTPTGVTAEPDAPAPVVVGQASEMDTALAVEAAKRVGVGIAATTETALPVTAAKIRAVGLAAESDTARALTRRKVAPLGLATETGAALGVMPARRYALGLTAELDTALGLSPRKLVALGVASEADLALGVTATGGAAGARIIQSAGLAGLTTAGMRVATLGTAGLRAAALSVPGQRDATFTPAG